MKPKHVNIMVNNRPIAPPESTFEIHTGFCADIVKDYINGHPIQWRTGLYPQGAEAWKNVAPYEGDGCVLRVSNQDYQFRVKPIEDIRRYRHQQLTDTWVRDSNNSANFVNYAQLDVAMKHGPNNTKIPETVKVTILKD